MGLFGGGGSFLNFIVGAALVVVGAFTEVFSAGASTSLVVMGLSMMASSVISATSPAPSPISMGDYGAASAQLQTGTAVQVSPNTSNKLPVVYGTSFVGGTVTDLSITSNNQELFYVISLAEVTGNGLDFIDITDIYYGGKKCVFSGPNVTGLIDPSTGTTDTTCNGYLSIHTYNNGSNRPINGSTNAITLMSNGGLTYQWNESKLMSNTVFAIVHITYNQNANMTSLQSTQFKIENSRYLPGDVLYDYMTNTVYGAAISSSQIDSSSLDALNTYSSEVITFTTYSGSTATQPRFRFDGTIDNRSNILSNLQNIASCADCLIKYNEIYGIWSVIVQKPAYTVAMDINDSNIVDAISVTTMDISNVYNIAQCQFPDITLNSNFNTATVDLSIVNPSLLYPNEPINTQVIKLPLVNNNVQAQLLATRFLKAARADLSVKLTINYIGLELEAGDVVTLTNANYGWTAKIFRVMQVVQNFEANGAITVDLNLQEYDPTVFNDSNIVQYTPPPNTGLSNPNIFGTIPAPVINNFQPSIQSPSFDVVVTTGSAGITQYAEIWYSAYSSPTSSQLIFAGTTASQSNGNPYLTSAAIPAVTLSGIAAGNWYFFSRMVNSVATSVYSPASSLVQWRPTTTSYSLKYLMVAYADDAVGTGFTLNPRGKAYYGLYNQSTNNPNSNPANYFWFAANPTFGTTNYLIYNQRDTRRFSFATNTAGFAAGTALFVPSNSTLYDPTVWTALEDGINYIDLDQRTGQLIATGTTTVGTGEIAVLNNPDGTIVAALQPYLDFGGAYTKTASAATITVDIYGRVVGFAVPDAFNYTTQFFNASSNQTVFSVTRGSGYITGQCWVFQNGIKLQPSEYTDASSSVTLSVGATLYDVITIVSFKSSNSTTGVYASFSYNQATLTNQSTYTASGFTLSTGYELLFLNGTVVNQTDYNISGSTISFTSGNTTGNLQIIQWTPNNLSVANGTPVNVLINTVIGQTVYSFPYDPLAVNIYENGCLLLESTDYTVGANTYTLANTPTTTLSTLLQQTFARTGAV